MTNEENLKLNYINETLEKINANMNLPAKEINAALVFLSEIFDKTSYSKAKIKQIGGLLNDALSRSKL